MATHELVLIFGAVEELLKLTMPQDRESDPLERLDGTKILQLPP